MSKNKTLTVAGLVMGIVSIVFLTMLTGYAQERESVVLRVITRGDVDSMKMDRMRVKYIEELYPWLKINTEPLAADKIHEFDSLFDVSFAAGNEPDLVCLDFELLEHVLKGQLLPLDQFTREDEEYQSWTWTGAESVDQLTYGGELYGFPRGMYVYVYWINEDLFDEAGIPYPEAGYTTQDMTDMATKLTKKDASGKILQYGFQSWSWSHQDIINSYPRMLGTSIWTFDEESGWVDGSNLNDPRVIEQLQWYADLHYKDGAAQIAPTTTQINQMGYTFNVGKSAINFGATWTVAGARREIGTRFRWSPVFNPVPREGLKPLQMLLTRPIGAVMSTTKNPEAAYLFLKTYSSPEIEKMTRDAGVIEQGLPYFENSLISEAWLNTDPPGKKWMQWFLDVIKEGRYWYSPENFYPQGYEEWLGGFSNDMYPTLTGEKTVQQVVDENYDKYQKAMAWTEITKDRIERFMSGVK